MNSNQLNQLKKLFPQVSFTPEIEKQFFEFWKEDFYQKSTYILEEGKLERFFRFVLEGIQVMYLNHKGKEIVLGFFFEGMVCSNFRSFLRKKPSELCIKAITPTLTLNISTKNYQNLFELSDDFKTWNKDCYENYILESFDRGLELITLSAQERYEKFIETCPNIYHQIPQKYLASYLNMTQETYSRMRSLVK